MSAASNVLIIDDDEIHNYLFAKRITNVGLSDNVVAVNSAQAGLERLQKLLLEDKIPEIIFLDLQMPALDGWEFLKKYEKTISLEYKNHIKIFMLSSSILPKDIKRAKDHPYIQEYIKKPLMEDELFVLKGRYFK